MCVCAFILVHAYVCVCVCNPCENMSKVCVCVTYVDRCFVIPKITNLYGKNNVCETAQMKPTGSATLRQ